jgi:thymidylate synthase (FAD)
MTPDVFTDPDRSIHVLDHGYVTLIEKWGSDERIIEAARMSTGKGFQGWGGGLECAKCGVIAPGTVIFDHDQDDIADAIASASCPICGGTPNRQPPGDEKLLRFLWENKHATPFEMAGATFEIQAPIFVFREWHRHRTQSYNEMSARYTPLPDVNYVPTVERLLINSKTNKQAGTVKGAEELDEVNAGKFQASLRLAYEDAERLYQRALAEGVPKELARVVLPVGRYSRMRASANLRNWLGFLTLRMDKAAQFEIRAYANAVHLMLTEKFPRTLALFDEGRR